MGILIRDIDTQGFKFEILTVTSATVGRFTSNVFLDEEGLPVKKAVVSVEGDPIRYIYDGSTTVTTGTGHLMQIGDVVIFGGIQNIVNARFLASSATATLQITYER